MLHTLRATASSGPVGRGVDVALGADELWRHAAFIASRLPPPAPGSMVTFAFGRDRGAFAAALLGTWLAGHGAALPENDRREYVVPVLDRPESVAFLHDTGVGRGVDVSRLLAKPHDAVTRPALLPEDPDRIVLETHTATSDGRIAIERWTAAQLLAQVDGLVELLQLEAGAIVAHGFTPAFLPAVLIGLLAPLRVGGSFMLGAPADGRELVEAAFRLGARTLLCSPPQLRGLAGMPSGSLQTVATIGCYGVVPERAAETLRAHHDVAVEELLSRGADPAEACVDKLLAVDRVDDAAVALLPDHDAALVAIVGAEDNLLRARAVAGSVFADEVALLVRAVPELPRGPNGRIPHGDLCTLFGRGRDGARVKRDLEWRVEPPSEDGTLRFRTRIPDRFTFFEGHFVTYPVLAGGVQLHELVLPCLRAAEFELGMLQRLDAIKFLARIAPGDQIEVRVQLPVDGTRLQFEIWCGDTRCTTGKLSFASPDAAENAPE